MRILKSFWNCILDFFFPSHCFNCKKALSNGKIICEKCYGDIERLPEKLCLVCGHPKNECECNNFVYYYSKCCSAFFNTGIAKSGMYSLKFGGKTSNASFFSKEMADCVKRNFGDVAFDMVCNVPAHPFKLIKRGFDQSELLAREISERLGIKFVSKQIKRKIFGKIQHKSGNISDRYENAYKSYFSKKKIYNKTVLLVDDIKTTGASLNACARALLYSGAKEVCCITALVSKTKS